MREILWLDASPNGETSISRRAGTIMLDALTRVSPETPAQPAARITVRELANEPIPFIDAAFSANMFMDSEESQDEPGLRISEILIAELDKADALVISTPMHNFTIPASLKAWIDQVARMNRTMKRTPQGKVGLLADRPTYVLVASGGVIRGEEARQPDFLTPYLQAILAAIGIKAVSFFYLEKTAAETTSPDAPFTALQKEIEEKFGLG